MLIISSMWRPHLCSILLVGPFLLSTVTLHAQRTPPLAEASGIRAAMWVWEGMPHAGIGVVTPRQDRSACDVARGIALGLMNLKADFTVKLREVERSNE